MKKYLEYLEAVNVDDIPMMILKIHLLTEHYLNNIIELSIDRADRILNKGNLSYYQKVLLVSSLANTPDSIIQCLLQLNSARNACAHKRNQDISLDDIDKIGRPAGRDYSVLKKQHGTNSKILLSHLSGYICAKMASVIDELEDALSLL